MPINITQDQQGNFKPVINNSIDFNMLITDPNWKASNPNMTSLTENMHYIKVDDKGKLSGNIVSGTYVLVDDVFTGLDFLSRDVRLSNYDKKDLKMVRWYIIFAGRCLNNLYFRAYKECMIHVAAYSESSQGKEGFLRKLMNTIRSENENKILEPPKKSFFTGKTDEE